MITPASKIELKLETAYRLIERERMDGVPILNACLEVQAVDFRLYQGMWLGVVITPWFMNLMLVPDHVEDPKVWDKDIGDKRSFDFPAGQFEFIFGEDSLIGKYYSCSLYSPMFDFGDQETAVLTARGVLEIAMKPAEIDELDVERENSKRMEEIWSRDEDVEEAQQPPVEGSLAKGEEPDLSRRSFLGMKKTHPAPAVDEGTQA
ncbi:[NiFe]-hydrogenase assembly chaperone HybE [Terasakiella pusilla]|uniref:[NiFe]-hydrogenase assembly chaperone HybE n=1 Tax=Terasakiella pusilla TaxID=64973 RepID=UPI003AA8500C